MAGRTRRPVEAGMVLAVALLTAACALLRCVDVTR